MRDPRSHDSRPASRADAPTSAGYEVKAMALRAYLTQLEKLGALPAVKARVSDETRRAMESPPLPSVWIDAISIEEMIDALQALHGLDAVRTVTRAGQTAGAAQILMPIVGGLLRLFGTRPDTLLARFPEMTKTLVRGVEFRWTRDAANAGHLTVTFPRKNVPRHVFVGMESGCWLMLDLCKAKGSVSDTQIVGDGSTGIIRVSW